MVQAAAQAAVDIYQSIISYTPTVNYNGGSGNAGGYSPAEGTGGNARNTYGWGGEWRLTF